MKIAVPTRGNIVDDHFGHCETFTLFTIDEKLNITKSEIQPSPHGCGCRSNIAGLLQDQGVSVMLTGNMGQGAFRMLHQHGIEVYRGCSGNVYEVAELFLRGQLSDSGVECEHHDHHVHHEGHQCSH